jgi:hypothetical protein
MRFKTLFEWTDSPTAVHSHFIVIQLLFILTVCKENAVHLLHVAILFLLFKSEITQKGV